jgi:Na+/H+ antiporter NhaD/arsenite permease-like protein
MDFIFNTAPVVLIIMIVMTFVIFAFFRKDLLGIHVDMKKIEKLDPSKAIKDKPLLLKCFFVFLLTMIGFFTHSVFHLEAATIAMAGAALLLLLTVEHPDDIYKEIEWNTIFFFSGLFIMVHSLEAVGLIEKVAEGLISLTGGNEMITALLILWFSGIASGIVDNIPITTVMVTVIKDLAATGIDPTALWWSLSLGACFGGNMTLIGASANIVGADICHKSNYPISFLKFLKYGAITSIISFVISSVYVYLRYFVLA